MRRRPARHPGRGDGCHTTAAGRHPRPPASTDCLSPRGRTKSRQPPGVLPKVRGEAGSQDPRTSPRTLLYIRTMVDARVAPVEQPEARKSPMRVALTVASAVGLVALSVRGASWLGASSRGLAAHARLRCRRSAAPRPPCASSPQCALPPQRAALHRRRQHQRRRPCRHAHVQTACAGARLRLAARPHGARLRPRGRRDRVARRLGGGQRRRGQEASGRTEPRRGQPRRPPQPVVQRAPVGPVEPRGHAYGRRPPHLGRQNVRGGWGRCPAAAAQGAGGPHAKPRAGVRCRCRAVLPEARCTLALRAASRNRCTLFRLALPPPSAQAIAEANRRMAGGGTLDPEVGLDLDAAFASHDKIDNNPVCVRVCVCVCVCVHVFTYGSSTRANC